MLLGLFLFWQIEGGCRRIGKGRKVAYNGIERPCFVPGTLPRIRGEAQMIVTHGTALLCRFNDLGPKLNSNKHNALSHHPVEALVTHEVLQVVSHYSM